MSAFFIAINRNKREFDPVIAQNMMTQLDRFGHDAKRLVIQDHYAIGYQSCWMVAEEEGEQQPLEFNDQQWFVFYGRLDNREVLLEALLETSAKQHGSNISDAVLAQCYLQSFGIERLTDLLGPFVLVNFNSKDDELVCARDGMGGRTLSYQITDDTVLIATYEMALAAHPAVDYRLNDETVANYLVNQMPQGPSSMISGLEVLHPGHSLTISESSVECRRFYLPDPERRVLFENDDEYAAEFKRLLAQAVARRMRCRGNIGTQLSGGMDSVPITILAKKEASKTDQYLSAYSWTFDQNPEADERKYSAPLCQKYGIEQYLIRCDDLWLNYDQQTSMDPTAPIYNPFMTYNHELFRQAKFRSVTVMLNGIHGDVLYDYTQGILYELIKAGQIRAALTEANSLLKSSGSIKMFAKHFILKPLSLVNRLLVWRARRNRVRDDILQPYIVDQLKARGTQVDYLVKESRRALRPSQWQVVLGDFSGGDAALGRFLESDYAIERRYPFRDRELCEFMLAIPSAQLALNSVKRPIVKRAFLNEFPDNIAQRNTKTYFADVTLGGIQNDEKNAEWGRSQTSEWSHYVKQCYFDGHAEQNHLFHVVKWRCGYYDYWKSVCYHPMAKKIGLDNERSK